MKKIVLLIVIALFSSHQAWAQTVAPVTTIARQAFLIDANTNTILYNKDGDSQMPTSSMSKMMTMYVVFQAIRDGKISMEDTFPVSEYAWKQQGSRMFLTVDQKARVEDLVRGVIVQSGNDAAVVFAEGLGGSESKFADMMNDKAKELGMTNSHFVNATGLPDPQHYSTAHDLAVLALALIHDFPEDYHFFSETEFTYNGIKQGNRNPLLYRNMDVDGLKTGHTDAGGFGLTVSALRGGRRLVLVLNGLKDMQERADESAKLLDWGYREYGFYPVVKDGDKLADVAVWLGQSPAVSLVATKDAGLTLPRASRTGLKTSITFDQPVPAPVTKGQELGKLIISAPGVEDQIIPLMAGEDVPQLDLMARVMFKLHQLFAKT